MYYALLDMRSSCTALTGLVWGETLKQVADSIIGECEMLMENTDDTAAWAPGIRWWQARSAWSGR